MSKLSLSPSFPSSLPQPSPLPSLLLHLRGLRMCCCPGSFSHPPCVHLLLCCSDSPPHSSSSSPRRRIPLFGLLQNVTFAVLLPVHHPQPGPHIKSHFISSLSHSCSQPWPTWLGLFGSSGLSPTIWVFFLLYSERLLCSQLRRWGKKKRFFFFSWNVG